MLKLWTIYVPRVDEGWLEELGKRAGAYLVDTDGSGVFKGSLGLVVGIQVVANETAMHFIAQQTKEYFKLEQVLYVQVAPQARIV